MDQSELPGADLVHKGCEDLDRGIESVESLLVSIAAERLRQFDVRVPEALPEPELRLYSMLSKRHGDGAHARYNSLLRRLVSFQRAIACAR